MSEQKGRRGRKPKDKNVQQYSTTQFENDKSQPKKKGRKTNQQKQQAQEPLTSLQMDSECIDQQDTVLHVNYPESLDSQKQTMDEQQKSLDFMQPNNNLDQNQFDSITSNIADIQLNSQFTKQQQQQDDEIQIVNNFMPTIQSTPQNDPLFYGSEGQQNKKKKDDPKSIYVPSYSQFQKNFQKQGKVFQDKETEEIINLSTKDRKWPQQVSSYCTYDCHPFTTTPIGIPVEITPDRKFKMQSYCCSLNCVMALIHQNNSPDLYKQINYLMEFQRRFFESTDHIPIAPNKELLRQFGGEFSIEQFRRSFQTLESSLYSRFNEPFEANEIIQQGQQIQKVHPEPQYNTNKSIPTELQSYQNL